MFSSKVKETSPAPQPLNAAPVKRAPLRTDHAPSIISGDLVVNGTLTSAGDLQIDGRVDGDIRSVGLVIGEKAEIHGEIYADDLTVRGKVFGAIRARKVQLCATCRVEGDILHEAFAVESGAFFEGNIRHSDNPLGEVAARKVAGPQAVVAAAPQNIVPAAPPPVAPPRMAPIATLTPLGGTA